MLRSERVLHRFLGTVIANVLRTAVSFATGILVARALGASDYGDLNFLLGSFAAINLVLDFGSSPAFYTLLSRRKRDRTFFALYCIWTFGIQLFGTLAVLWIVLPSSVIERIWLGHSRKEILLAFGVSFALTQLWTMVSQLAEAVRKTVVIQAVAVAQAIAHLLLVLTFIRLHMLSVTTILWLLILEYVVAALVIGPRMLLANLASDDSQESSRSVISEFVAYGRPLVIYGLVGFLYQFADRWLLQRFGGAKQQGFFAVGQQFASVSLIATTSILNVLWKEVADGKADPARTQSLYASIRRGLYFLAAWLSCLVIPYTRELLHVTVGDQYQGAALATALMLLYPIHQSLGQIQGTYLMATGNTRTHAAIGMFSMLLSIPATYLMTAPRTALIPGFALGATGLVIKLVAVQLVAVSVQTIALSRIGAGRRDFAYQFALVFSLLGFSVICRILASKALGPLGLGTSALALFSTGACLYIAMTLFLILRLPDIAGLTPFQVTAFLERSRRFVYS
jgi:O-antigen/teichoic acid export membrane protein